MTDGTYIGFLILTFIGACLAWTLVDAKTVVRSDGSHVILMKNPTWQSELLGLVEVLKTDVWIICLFPMFLASNWFYTYQFNGFNSAKFDIRTRALNSILYWTSQIIGAYVFGYGLDIKTVRRSMKAKVVWGVLFVITMVIWGGGYAWQKGYTRAQTASKTAPKMDWTSNGYVGPMFLYMFYGFYDGKPPIPKPPPKLPSHQRHLSCLANLHLLVHGRHDQQRPQTRQLRRLLQGHPVRRRSHHLPHRRAQGSLYERTRLELGAARGQSATGCAACLDEDPGYRAD